jgi:hypothetical protein
MWALDDAHEPIREERLPSRALRLKFQSRHPGSQPSCQSRSDFRFFPRDSNSQAWVLRKNSVAFPVHRKTASPPGFQLERSCKSDGVGTASPWQQSKSYDDWPRNAVTYLRQANPETDLHCGDSGCLGNRDTPSLAPPPSRPRVDLSAPIASAQAQQAFYFYYFSKTEFAYIETMFMNLLRHQLASPSPVSISQ